MLLNNRKWQIIIIGMLALSLSGCGNSRKMNEVKNYVRKVKSQAIREIEPLPIVKPYETFTYHDENMRSPFMPPQHNKEAKKVIADNGIHPDVNRHKEPLEGYPLDSLRMVGTLQQDTKVWAIIVDPTGAVHRITKGNYVGQNDGHVDNISDNKIQITEIVPDPSGGWRERKAEMALATENQGKNAAKTPASKTN